MYDAKRGEWAVLKGVRLPDAWEANQFATLSSPPYESGAQQSYNPAARHEHLAFTDGATIFVMGGFDDDGRLLTDGWALDLCCVIPAFASQFTVSFSLNPIVTLSWSRLLLPAEWKGSVASACARIAHRVYIFGGTSRELGELKQHNKFFKFNLKTNQLTLMNVKGVACRCA